MAIDHLLSGEISFGLVKVSSLQDPLTSEILTLLGKTVGISSLGVFLLKLYCELENT